MTTWVRLAAALVLLNASVTFVNVWPTLAIRPAWRISPDLAALVLALVLAAAWRGAPAARPAERLLAICWVVLILAQYLRVSTESLYGREVNLYWDLKLLPDVGAMFADVARPRVLAALAAALVAIPLLLFLPARWAIATLDRAVARRHVRVAALAGSLAVLLAAALPRRDDGGIPQAVLARPVSTALAGELVELAREASATRRPPLPPAPSVDSDLAHVQGADVVLLVVESYGMASWDRPALQGSLAPARALLAGAIADTGRAVVTTTVESTTFGGESWLAHISLLSGTEVRDPDRYRRLMTERRDTLVTTFSRRGYRTLAIMPGLQAPWPEGSFYGFDRIYGAPDLGYRGPPFGWWDVTDQFVLARMDTLALSPAPRAPAFVFVPTISTHVPFTPVPPYQSDWARLLTPAPYEHRDLERAYEAEPDWSDLGPAYARSLAYTYETLSGYLRLHAGRDIVLIIVGDHQPPALVSGEGASWNVPVHVIASREVVLERLRARDFRDGLAPEPRALTRIDGLLPILLHAFGSTSTPWPPGL